MPTSRNSQYYESAEGYSCSLTIYLNTYGEWSVRIVKVGNNDGIQIGKICPSRLEAVSLSDRIANYLELKEVE